jgi:hypothetical protein
MHPRYHSAQRVYQLNLNLGAEVVTLLALALRPVGGLASAIGNNNGNAIKVGAEKPRN